MYRSPAVQLPQLSDLAQISDDLGLHCSGDDLKEYKAHMDELFEGGYQRVDELVAPTLPAKYPRTPGHRPQPEDNKCNAWFWKCDIHGAPEGKLKGKRLGIKDSIAVAGLPMMVGSPLLSGYVADSDATIVTRILDAGGHIIGKVNCENLCASGSSWTSCMGPTLNPHNVAHTCGGSSSGSATALVTGDVDMTVCGDQGGSVRIPSSWCGTVGLKPTWGLVPYTGACHVELTVDHLGPMANTVADCALLLEVMAGYDGGSDPRQPRDLVVPEYTKQLTGDLTGRKIGVVREGFETCDDDVTSIVRAAAESLTRAGAVVEEVSIPWHSDGDAIWGPIFLEGLYQFTIKGNGNGYHWKGYYPTSVQDHLANSYKTQMKDLPETMKMICLSSEYVARNYGNKFYAKAQNLNMRLTEEYNKALDTYDVIVMPTVPYKAPKLPDKDWSITQKLKNSLGMTRNTSPFCCTGHPSLSINAGWSEGLPVGMMITGKLWDDATVLQVAHAYEQIRDGNKDICNT